MTTREFSPIPARDFDWETVTKGNMAVTNSSIPYLSVTMTNDSHAQLGFNRAALERLGNPTHVVVHVDRKGEAIGVEASTDRNPNAYKIGTNNRANISVLPRKIGMTRPGTIRMEAHRQGDYLVALVDGVR